MELGKQLAEIPLFHGLPQEQLEKLADITLEKRFQKGQSLFLEGSKASGFYTVLSGKVKIFKVSLEGKEQILHIFGKGESFGEVPMFAGGNFPAHAEALENLRVLFFPRDSFVHLLKREPSLAMNMLAMLSQRLRYFTHLVEDLSLKEVPGRLAAYFLYLQGHKKHSRSFQLDITKGQLASILGTIPETLSRILARMSQREIIRVSGRNIEILDVQALENLAAGEKLLA